MEKLRTQILEELWKTIARIKVYTNAILALDFEPQTIAW